MLLISILSMALSTSAFAGETYIDCNKIGDLQQAVCEISTSDSCEKTALKAVYALALYKTDQEVSFQNIKTKDADSFVVQFTYLNQTSDLVYSLNVKTIKTEKACKLDNITGF